MKKRKLIAKKEAHNKRFAEKKRKENGSQRLRNNQMDCSETEARTTHCEDGETGTLTTRKAKHEHVLHWNRKPENGLRGRRRTKPDCKG